MEGDPFAVIEAMTIAGFAIGAEQGWIYIRGEYPVAEEHLKNAIEEAKKEGLLGSDISGSGFILIFPFTKGLGLIFAVKKQHSLIPLKDSVVNHETNHLSRLHTDYSENLLQ